MNVEPIYTALIGGAYTLVAVGVLTNEISKRPDPTLEVRVVRVTNTVYVPMPPPAERTPNLADLYAVPMPMYPPSIHPVITNWIYGMPLGQLPTNIIWGGSLLYTNGTAITNSGPYTNGTMTVVTNGGAK